MRVTRRRFVRTASAAGAALTLPFRSVSAFCQTLGTASTSWPSVGKFLTSLRGPGPGGIPIAAPDAFPAPVTGALHYSLEIAEFQDQLHPSFDPTTLWGYNPLTPLGGVQPQRHLGGLIVAQRNVPIQVTFTNRLPPKHILPVDVSGFFMDAAANFGNGLGPNAACVHLHGGLVPWISDGGPMSWFDPYGNYGPSINGLQTTLNPGLLAGQAEHYYPNRQSARMLWYHDHAHDITRLNAYAGIASAYIIRDDFEGDLRNLGLPDFVENGGREIPLVIQDKTFVGPHIATLDPTWPGPTSVGSLWYPHTYGKHERKERHKLFIPDPSCVPEMFGNTMLVNGTVYPVGTVEARRYRFRILNACQGRFLNLQLYVADSTPDGIQYDRRGVPLNTAGPDFTVLGTEGGFLPHPVIVPGAQRYTPALLDSRVPSLLTAPAERWDLLVDFSGLEGKSLILYTDAPAPLPMGAIDTDYYTGGRMSQPGYGPDTRILMKFTVVDAQGEDAPLQIDVATDLTGGLDAFLVPPDVAVQNGVLHLPPGVAVRSLTLNESEDDYGRLLQTLGTTQPIDAAAYGYGRSYESEATETPVAGTTEVWQIANLSADVHPIHFHLVNVQVLARQPFDVSKYAGTPIYTGPARGPNPTELGWKETVQANPGEVTTVIMKFDLPSVPFAVPSSPRTGGAEYVWHCHILEHEEHDMMRPLVVI